MKDRLEMGRRLLKLLGSEPGFLRIGETAAVLRGAGNEPVVREEWMIAAIRGSSEGRQDMTKAVGRGSNWHVDGFEKIETTYSGTLFVICSNHCNARIHNLQERKRNLMTT